MAGVVQQGGSVCTLMADSLHCTAMYNILRQLYFNFSKCKKTKKDYFSRLLISTLFPQPLQWGYAIRWFSDSYLLCCLKIFIFDFHTLKFTFCVIKFGGWFFFIFRENFNWRIVALQNFVIFCQTSTRINHRYTLVPSLPTSLLSPSPSHPSTCHRAPIWVPWVIQQIPIDTDICVV